MTPNPSSVFGGKRPQTRLSARPPQNKMFEDTPVLPKNNPIEVQSVFARARRKLELHAQSPRRSWSAATLASACELLEALFFTSHRAVDAVLLDPHVLSDVLFGFTKACVEACLCGLPGQKGGWYYPYRDKVLLYLGEQAQKQRPAQGVRLAS